MENKRLLHVCQAALLAALSVVLVYFVHFPLIPSAPFLEYDMADVPVLLVTFLLGPGWGFGILTVVSLIQAFMLGGNGWVGAVMHIVSSGVLLLAVGLIYRNSGKMLRLVLALAVGTVAMALVMIPMNLIFTVHFLGSPRAVVEAMILPAILPFNLLKAGINSILAGILLRMLTPVISRYGARWGLKK